MILDEDGNEVPDGKAGNICITNPWPGIMQTVWGQPERFISVYYAKYNKDPESARTGGTGRTSPATARSAPPTGTTGSWAGSMT